MDYREILFERKDKIAVLTLNKPDIRNALTSDTIINEIVDACDTVQGDSTISVLIVTGAGSAFSAGGNVKDMHNREGMFAGDAEQMRNNYRDGIQRIPQAFIRLDAPVICAVNGAAVGAGLDLACLCDIRIASEKARFAQTVAALGLIPGVGSTQLLPRIVGFSKASELVYTCRMIDAAEALRIGLVNEVTAPDRLMERSMELAAEIAKQPARTLRMAKRLFKLSEGRTLAETLEIAASFQALCHEIPEHQDAVAELLKKIEGK